jgi:nucleoid-associated protein YgaU
MAKNRQQVRDAPTWPTAPMAHVESPARAVSARRGVTGLLTLGIVFAAAAAALGTRAWQVGSNLGTALFPVEDIVELAAVAVGTVVAGWVGLHALLALACVAAGRRGRRWAAGERTLATHAPAFVRRLARAAAGAGLGLALAVPTAMAAPDRATGTDPAVDGGASVVLDLGWQPTARQTVDQDQKASRVTDGSASSSPRPRPERLTLVNRGQRTGAVRESLVVVEPGDTLWAIAAGRLTAGPGGPGSSDAEIASAVTRWHQANRPVLGGNPDLIQPGAVLREP